MVLFFSENKQNNFIIELLTSLYDLLKTYIGKARQKDDEDHYMIYSRTVLANALHIANNRKDIAEVDIIFKILNKYTFKVHQSWDITHHSTLHAIIDSTNFAI